MKSDLVAKPLLSGTFWSMLFVSLFCAPVIMAARVVDDGEHTADLIRQHQEATGPGSSAVPDSASPGACEQLGDARIDQETSMGAGGPDATMIRPVGKRSNRIRV